ncbi:V-type ATP synthase subunit I [Kaistia dalseonensis]|uniref:V/A-type H+-transporting ATPase subunit I n=1 Tax=Kaistia dalseonensis TaxID=410840 RepID=A0ABU0H3Z3_9HYPH|nr:V-type ATP synthase subunit I [Kaistia dalseonensis]MCX5494449.1 V-type ATP synthase subunit I [Kaistia dalseonensis]MDQ0437028.1 V/A-type H+-transporting ATPase subunit I [Kaistia dalseonensis]
MSIVAMQKVAVCGPLPEKDAVIEALQRLGVLHLIPLTTADPLAPTDAAERNLARTAFRHLTESPEQRRLYRPGTAFDLTAIVREITENRRRLRRLSDRRDELIQRIGDVSIWGDIELPPIDALGGERFWFYVLPIKERAALDRLQLPWAIVGKDTTHIFIVVVTPEEPAADLLPVPRTHFGARPLHELTAELDELEIDLDKARAERGELTRWRLLLGAELAGAEDADERRDVASKTLDTDGLFALQGWAPAESVTAIEQLALDQHLAVLAESPTADDKPPTLLRPHDARLGGGADLTNFYTTPAYGAWDPSFIVFTSFAIFFAMILADAGYAALIGLIVVWYWSRMGKTESGQRMRVMLTVIAGASFIYGVLAGSYFGVAPPKGGLLAKLAIIDVTNFDEMMKLSVVIGAVHIGIALAATAWLGRHSLKVLVPIGWLAVIAGGLLIWLGGGAFAIGGPAILIAGFVSVFIGAASGRVIRTKADWLLRFSDGFMGLTGITKLFGDILSYLRLFALGLASASLATTFNGMAAGLQISRPGLGLLASILILLFGHAINFVIGIMGGVVHGLRLNYIEFFGWGLSEEGYPFRAFAKREIPE